MRFLRLLSRFCWLWLQLLVAVARAWPSWVRFSVAIARARRRRIQTKLQKIETPHPDLN